MKQTRIDLILTEQINAIDYLEKTNYFIQKTNKEKIAWKWVVLSLHGALYGFAICALRGNNPYIHTVEEKKECVKKIKCIHCGKMAEKIVKNSSEKLISFDGAIKKCEKLRITMDDKKLILTNKQKESIRKLKKVLRNNLEHYKSGGLAIEINGLPRIAIDILDIIEILALKTYTIVDLEPPQIKKIKFCINQSIEVLQNHILYKDIDN